LATSKPKSFRASTRYGNKKTPVENLMNDQLIAAGIDGFERNVRFIPKRRFEADFYFKDLKLALEIDGGVFLPKSGHTSGEGYTKDRRRDQLALAHGIQTIRVTSNQVRSGEAIAFVSAYVPIRRKEIERLAASPAISTDFASLLPTRFGT